MVLNLKHLQTWITSPHLTVTRDFGNTANKIKFNCLQQCKEITNTGYSIDTTQEWNAYICSQYFKMKVVSDGVEFIFAESGPELSGRQERHTCYWLTSSIGWSKPIYQHSVLSSPALLAAAQHQTTSATTAKLAFTPISFTPEVPKPMGKGNKSGQLSDFSAIILLQMYYPAAGISFQTAFNTTHPSPCAIRPTLWVFAGLLPQHGIKMRSPNHTAFPREELILFLLISVVEPS